MILKDKLEASFSSGKQQSSFDVYGEWGKALDDSGIDAHEINEMNSVGKIELLVCSAIKFKKIDESKENLGLLLRTPQITN